MNYKDICSEIKEKVPNTVSDKPFVIAIDGRCGSGKSTLAEMLAGELGCEIIHMDDFYLRLEQRTPERLATPGGNVDRERILEEVFPNLRVNSPLTYTPFICSTKSLGEPKTISIGRAVIVEGSYACHPELAEYYDLSLFLTVDPAEQLKRILKRNGAAKAEEFKQRWIPLEELYFTGMNPQNQCTMIIDTTEIEI